MCPGACLGGWGGAWGGGFTTSALLHPASTDVPRVLLPEVHVAPLHPAAQQDPIRVLNKLGALVLRPFDHTIRAVLRNTSPLASLWVIDQIFPEDDADVIEFEALG